MWSALRGFSIEAVSVVVFLSVMLLSLSASRSEGLRQAKHLWLHEGVTVYFDFKGLSEPSSLKFSDRMVTFNEDRELKYLFSTEKVHYAYVREEPCSPAACAGLVFKIPAEMVNEVLLIRY